MRDWQDWQGLTLYALYMTQKCVGDQFVEISRIQRNVSSGGMVVNFPRMNVTVNYELTLSQNMCNY